jgi:hypothetical protein
MRSDQLHQRCIQRLLWAGHIENSIGSVAAVMHINNDAVMNSFIHYITFYTVVLGAHTGHKNVH